MKISCEIIRDLLPLYHDGVCSNESKQMIEEHLSNCEKCRTELKEMDDMLNRLINWRELDDIIYAAHNNPHQLLGTHITED